jgi:hypothetical protein
MAAPFLAQDSFPGSGREDAVSPRIAGCLLSITACRGFDADERVYQPAAEMLRQLGYGTCIC